jgi:hypothetical protein
VGIDESEVARIAKVAGRPRSEVERLAGLKVLRTDRPYTHEDHERFAAMRLDSAIAEIMARAVEAR